MDVKEKYKKLRKKYDLPKFGDINNEFEISSIDETEFLLRDIMRKIREKIHPFIKILDEILQPDTSSFSSIHEFRAFNEEDKEKVYNTFRKMMQIDRSTYLLEINDGNEDLAKLINKSFKEWLEIKKTLPEFLEKMKNRWEEKIDGEEELGYLG